MAIQTITEQIYKEIRNGILSGEVKAGEKLTIKMLHEKYGVSSSPIREALTRLQQDGLIEYKPNVGMSAVTLTLKDLREIYTLMTELDIIALRFSIEGGNADRLVKSMKENQRQCSEAGDDEAEWGRISDEFHLILYRYADNSRLNDAARKLRMQYTIFSSAYEKIPANRKSIIEEHQTIIDAIESGDGKAAEAALRKHEESSYVKALKVASEVEGM